MVGYKTHHFRIKPSSLSLNRKHRLAELVVIDVHKQNKHCWIKHTLNELRQKFWINKGRQFIQKTLFTCRTCRKYNGPSYSYPRSPPLTSLRLNDTRPFKVVGIDLCGPVFVKNVFWESDDMFKCWIVLYTCAASRGIVLDVVPDVSAKTFFEEF